MEKGHETSPALTSAAGTPPLPEGPRRRAGGGKRKGSSSLSSNSAKRHAKERNNPFALLPPVSHNGPVTRARQSPNKLAAAASAVTPREQAAAVSASEGADGAGGKGGVDAGDGVGKVEELVVPEVPLVDAEFEAVRSRGSTAHVVPTHAGWFSWKKVHSLEELTLTSFFNGKNENRTSDVYVQIRDSIIKKFHADPQTQLETNDLSEISSGDPDSRQEVMEFLDHWGLINFHPFPPTTSDVCDLEADGEAKFSPIEKLYQFGTIHPSFLLDPRRVNSAAPAAAPRLLTDSALSEDLVRPEEPSVEYHCNSCSGDCSRKRYHCQKQADFDLCTDCFNAEKFGKGMVAADFILMESAGVRGISGGSWTDQETLLLLEALELYGENWNEIAEHVATKTKAQCILHFVQMPIEDPFLEASDDPDTVPGDTELVSSNKESTASDIPETTDSKGTEKGDQITSSPKNGFEQKDGNVAESDQEASPNIVMDALKAAFQDVGSLPEKEGLLSFAEAGNPVMALAAFLAHLVEPDIATFSTRSSQKAIYEESPGIQLAMRHCFSLEDPPNDSNDQPNDCKDSATSKSGDVQKEENKVDILNGTEESKEAANLNDAKSIEEAKELPASSECSEDENVKEPANLDLSEKEDAPNAASESADPPSPGKRSECNVVEDSDGSALKAETSDGAMQVSGDLPLKGGTASSMGQSASKETDSVLKEEETVKGFSAVISSEEAKTSSVDMVPPAAPSEMKELKMNSCSPEPKDRAGDEETKLASSETENCKSVESDSHLNINRIKRAAVTALATSAVKAKLLAKQEEEQILQLASMVIGKQLQKLETKLALVNDVDGVIMRIKEQLDRARKKLYHERTQIIAARFGFPAASRPPQPSLPMRFGAPQGSLGPGPTNMVSQKPPINRP